MKRNILILIATLAVSASLARANGISWGNNPFGATNDPSVNLYMYNSTGGLLDNTFTFDLGTWNSGFTPTAANVSQWAANWNVISSAYSPSANGWLSLDPTDPNVNNPNYNPEFFQRTITFNTNGTVNGGGSTVFQQGQQVYIWAFNSQAAVASSDWALVTDINGGGNTANAWTVPDPTDTLNTGPTWNLSDADTAIFGEVNGVTGAGLQWANPGANSLQTFSLASVVPEPGSALLVLLAGVALRARRRQRMC